MKITKEEIEDIKKKAVREEQLKQDARNAEIKSWVITALVIIFIGIAIYANSSSGNDTSGPNNVNCSGDRDCG